MNASKKFRAIIGAMLIGAACAAVAETAKPAPIFEKMRESGVEEPSPSPECLGLREIAKKDMIIEDDFILSGGEVEWRLVLSAPSSMAPEAASAGMSIACLLAKSDEQSWPISVSVEASYREGSSAEREAPENGLMLKAARTMAFASGSATASAERELRACFKRAAANRKKFKNSKISLGEANPGGKLGISCDVKRERGEGLIFHAAMSPASKE